MVHILKMVWIFPGISSIKDVAVYTERFMAGGLEKHQFFHFFLTSSKSLEWFIVRWIIVHMLHTLIIGFSYNCKQLKKIFWWRKNASLFMKWVFSFLMQKQKQWQMYTLYFFPHTDSIIKEPFRFSCFNLQKQHIWPQYVEWGCDHWAGQQKPLSNM